MPAGRCQYGKPDTRSKQRKPDRWIRDKDHRGFVRSLPCCCCPMDEQVTPTEAAHIRKGTDGAANRKPSDKWVVPLCGMHHWIGPLSQHDKGEETFWSEYGDPLPLAEHLWRVSGDMEAGMRAVERFRMKLAL